MVLSFTSWLSVFAFYEDKVKRLTIRSIAKWNDNAKERVTNLASNWDNQAREQLRKLLDEYSVTNQPKQWLKQGINFFKISGFFFLGATLSELVSESIKPIVTIENFTIILFFYGIISFVWGIFHIGQVQKFISSVEPVDPILPSLGMILFMSLFQIINLLLLATILPSTWSTSLVGKILAGLLFLSVASGFIIVLRWSNSKAMERIIEILLLSSPYFYFSILLILLNLNISF